MNILENIKYRQNRKEEQVVLEKRRIADEIGIKLSEYFSVKGKVIRGKYFDFHLDWLVEELLQVAEKEDHPEICSFKIDTVTIKTNFFAQKDPQNESFPAFHYKQMESMPLTKEGTFASKEGTQPYREFFVSSDFSKYMYVEDENIELHDHKEIGTVVTEDSQEVNDDEIDRKLSLLLTYTQGEIESTVLAQFGAEAGAVVKISK